MNWKEKVVVVTGASTGIGRAAVREMVSRGARVTGIARTRGNLEALRGECGCEVEALDVGDAAAVEAALRAVEERHGWIDVLVNNAGTGVYGPVTALEPEGYEQTLRTNFLGAVFATRAVLPGMLGRRSGAIVNVSSPIAFSPAAGQSAYASSKAALDAFSEALLMEIEGKGVSVSIVYPGWVDTPLTRNEFGRMPKPPKSVQMPPERVAAAILRAAETGRFRLFLPWFTGLAPVVKGLAPGFLRRQTAKTQPLPT